MLHTFTLSRNICETSASNVSMYFAVYPMLPVIEIEDRWAATSRHEVNDDPSLSKYIVLQNHNNNPCFRSWYVKDSARAGCNWCSRSFQVLYCFMCQYRTTNVLPINMLRMKLNAKRELYSNCSGYAYSQPTAEMTSLFMTLSNRTHNLIILLWKEQTYRIVLPTRTRTVPRILRSTASMRQSSRDLSIHLTISMMSFVSDRNVYITLRLGAASKSRWDCLFRLTMHLFAGIISLGNAALEKA